MGDLASAITCPMCMVQYDTSSNEPRNLKCNHTFCRCCITSLTSKAKRDCQPCRCPTCRAEIIWDSEIPVAIQFPMNFALCNVVDACAIPEFSFKVILIGDGGVGKTTLLRKHLFPDDTRLPSVTLGANFITETILRSGKHLKIQYWDTAGQERLALVTNSYMRGVDGAFLRVFSFLVPNKSSCLIIFSLTELETFSHLTEWKNKLESFSPGAVVFLVGNKSDKSDRAIESDTATNFAQKNSWIYHETCAQGGSGVNELFEAMIGEMAIRSPIKKDTTKGTSFTLVPPDTPTKGTKGKCNNC